MNRQQTIFLAKSVAILSVIPVLIYAHSAGPDPGKSGAPGESTCNEASCHVGTGLNAGPGSVKINAEGTTYVPGVTQRIQVTVSDPNQRRWGFQLTARLGSDSRTRAGILTPLDGSIISVCAAANLQEVTCTAAPVRQYVEHSDTGSIITAVGAGNTFSFDWTPPVTDVGQVTLYAAGNAANGNTLETGDRIYTTTLTLNPASLPAKPVITEIVHDGDFQPGISPNGWVVIKGTNLAGNVRVWEGRDFRGNLVPTTLDGVKVKINGKDAFVYFISPTQINALAPVDSTTGNVDVQVSYQGQTSNVATTQLKTATPAFFLFQGSRYIAALHENFTFLGPTNLYPGLSTPAKPGDLIVLFASGFGPTDPAVPNGRLVTTAGKLTSSIKITMGGVDVTPSSADPRTFAGLSATGVYQLNIRVPDSAPNGDVPIVATIDGVATQLNAFVAVQK